MLIVSYIFPDIQDYEITIMNYYIIFLNQI